MLWLQKIKDSPNYPRIKNSVELKAQRRNALFVWIVTAVMLLIAAVAGVGKSAKSTVSFVIIVLFMIPYSLYYVYRVGVLFWKIERWTFSETTLDRPHLGYKDGAWFTVTVRDRSGRELEKETSHIFGTASDPVFEDYVNSRVLIGYHDESDTVAVIQNLD